MELEVEEVGPVERRLRIQVATADVDAAFDAVYQQIGRSAQLKGFRRGRVPRSVLERRFGEQARGEVLERLVRESLPNAIRQAELDEVVTRVDPEGEPVQGTPYAYAARVEIRPQIELAQVRGLEVEAPTAPEQDPDAPDALTSYLERLQAAHTQLVEEPPETLAAPGHVVIVSFEGTLDGRAFPGGRGEEARLELGSGSAIPGFEEQIEGLAAGSEREFDLDLPESYSDESLAGRTVHFRARLLEIRRREVPEVDDELAKDVSEFASIAELRADLEKRIDEERETQRKRQLQRAVLDALVARNPFPSPPSLVERRLAARLESAVQSLAGRVPIEELREQVERWREEWRAEAERDVRVGFLVPRVAESEGIEVGDEEVESRLREHAATSGESLAKLRRRYTERGLLDALRAQLVEERVVDFLLSEASLSES